MTGKVHRTTGRRCATRGGHDRIRRPFATRLLCVLAVSTWPKQGGLGHGAIDPQSSQPSLLLFQCILKQ